MQKTYVKYSIIREKIYICKENGMVSRETKSDKDFIGNCRICFLSFVSKQFSGTVNDHIVSPFCDASESAGNGEVVLVPAFRLINIHTITVPAIVIYRYIFFYLQELFSFFSLVMED